MSATAETLSKPQMMKSLAESGHALADELKKDKLNSGAALDYAFDFVTTHCWLMQTMTPQERQRLDDLVHDYRLDVQDAASAGIQLPML